MKSHQSTEKKLKKSEDRCCVEGCDRDAVYKKICMCQKHYFRLRRNGNTNLSRQTNGCQSCKNSAGYVMVKIPEHPLAMKNGYVYEHRASVFEKYGFKVPPCEICQKNINWNNLHVDHIDNIVDNNEPENLRVLCRACNVMRARVLIPSHQRKGNHRIEYEGEIKTAQEWSRDPRIRVAGNTIINRLKKGMSVKNALFSTKKTHVHTKPSPKNPAYGEFIGKNNTEI